MDYPIAKPSELADILIPEEDGAFRGAVNERILAEMLKKWHVELSGDELGIQAWEEKF